MKRTSSKSSSSATFEVLEGRRMFALTPTVQLEDPWMIITGTESPERITVRLHDNQVTVMFFKKAEVLPFFNQSYSGETVHFIRIEALGGNDTITLIGRTPF